MIALGTVTQAVFCPGDDIKATIMPNNFMPEEAPERVISSTAGINESSYADASPVGPSPIFRGHMLPKISRQDVQNEARWEHCYGALDLGTNNCRLLIAKPGRNGLRVVDAYSRIVRLGEGLTASHQLSDESQERTVAALKICAEKLQKKQVRLTRHVATEACRRAKNCRSFVERVYAETGLCLDVISPAEEARLAVLGCQSLLNPRVAYALVFDIGGGSTELILVRQKGRGDIEVKGWVSVPWGVVSLAESYGGAHVDAATYDAMYGEVANKLIPFAQRMKLDELTENGELQALGTSGTVTTLAAIHLGLLAYDRRRIDGANMPLTVVRELCQRVGKMSYAERVAEGCVGRERADLVIPGCAILEAIADQLKVAEIRVAGRGLREGILRSLMVQDGFRV
jgi:exopolyphosphatase / guanosine-5'-triphosphate,3'-diphosphate pyrophosphatase